MHSTHDDQGTWFVRQMANVQRGLYAYILQMLPNRADADDVLQRANLVMWTKREELVEGSNFVAWAARIAYFEVLTWRKQAARNRLCFDDLLVERLSREAADDAGWMGTFVPMLRRCMDQLSQPDRELLEMQYVERSPPARHSDSVRPLVRRHRPGYAPHPQGAVEVHRRTGPCS